MCFFIFFVWWGEASTQRIVFSADIVASACHVVVDADSNGNSGQLTFGTYRKSTGTPVPPRDFTVHLYESGATVQGCSAFQAGRGAPWILATRASRTQSPGLHQVARRISR